MNFNKKEPKTNFLIKYVLGHKTNLNSSDDVLEKCINLAYNDMLQGRQGYTTGFTTKDNNKRKEKFTKLIQKYTNKETLFNKTLELFDNTKPINGFFKYSNSNREVSILGLTQKLINMSFKYFYTFQDFLPKFDFSECDCPIDSHILAIIGNIDSKFKSYKWTCLDLSQYNDCQTCIKQQLQNKKLNDDLKNISNLAFDFLNW